MKYFFAFVIAVSLIEIEAQVKPSSGQAQGKSPAQRDKVTKNCSSIFFQFSITFRAAKLMKNVCPIITAWNLMEREFSTFDRTSTKILCHATLCVNVVRLDL